MHRLEDLLFRTSRTFALAVPLLEEPLLDRVRIAYLLFRIADTLEDADRLGRDARLALLGQFADLLGPGSPPPNALEGFVAACRATPPTGNQAYAELLGATGEVFAALDASGEGAEVVRRHLLKTARRMSEFVARADASGSLALRDLADLRAYCYAVAGIVGEMLTELVVLAEPDLRPARERLEADAVAFGEGLQLTNILKDAGADLAEGRTYVPRTVDRVEVFELASEDLVRARRYVGILYAHGARRGTLGFHALPVRLAEATLARVHRDGAGAKLTRTEVAAELAAMHADLGGGGSGLGDESSRT